MSVLGVAVGAQLEAAEQVARRLPHDLLHARDVRSISVDGGLDQEAVVGAADQAQPPLRRARRRAASVRRRCPASESSGTCAPRPGRPVAASDQPSVQTIGTPCAALVSTRCEPGIQHGIARIHLVDDALAPAPGDPEVAGERCRAHAVDAAEHRGLVDLTLLLGRIENAERRRRKLPVGIAAR